VIKVEVAMNNNHQKFLSVQQVSENCGVSTATVEKWLGKSSKTKGSKNYQIGLEDYISFLNDLQNNEQYKEHENPLRVVVIDEEQTEVEKIGSIFSNQGFSVTTAQDAIKAGSLINAEKPHIVTVDLTLAYSNGLDVIKIINGLKLTEKIWIIVISADSEEKIQEAIDLGADCYLQKPFSQNDLKKLINKFSPNENLKLAKAS
jgi:response regulator RpfG family c-di-GMP phosphodiesterase